MIYAGVHMTASNVEDPPTDRKTNCTFVSSTLSLIQWEERGSQAGTHLRGRALLLVHGSPRSGRVQLPSQTLSLQVNIFVRVLFLCGEEVYKLK